MNGVEMNGPLAGECRAAGRGRPGGNRLEGVSESGDAGPPSSPVSRSNPKGDRLQPVDPWGPTEGSSHRTSDLPSQHPIGVCEHIH